MVYAWEEHVYLDQRTLRATGVVESVIVEARFTPGIPAPSGPGPHGALPGMTLMETNPASGEINATNQLDLSGLSDVIEPPSRGRKVSEQRYCRTRKHY